MRRLSPVVLTLLALLVAGCGGEAAPPGEAPQGEPVGASQGAPLGGSGLATRLRVGFPPRGLVDTIEIDAVDRLPLHAAALVAPDGRVTPASYLNVTDSPSFATGQSALGNTWRDAVEPSGLLPGFGIENARAGAAILGREQLLAMVSFAEIPLPDPVVYRREWRQYRIRLTFGTPPGALETRVIPAPAPPLTPTPTPEPPATTR